MTDDDNAETAARTEGEMPENGGADAPAGEPGAEAADAGEDLYQDLEQARAKADEHWEMYLRMAADLENYRRRVERELTNAHKFGVEKFAAEMLTVVDSLELGLKAASEAPSVESLNEGMAATLRVLNQALHRFGISEVDPLDQPFDPERHEAVAVLPSADKDPDSVLEVVQKGFTLHDRLLRPARVVVTKAPDSD